jgi:DNA-directed RNA polymerase specialized sigma subunit
VHLWDSALRQQIYLGDDAFVERMQARAEQRRSSAREIPKVQRRKPKNSLGQWLANCDSREEALYRAYTESGLSMTEMADELGLSVSRVSRLIARVEEAKGKT